MTEWDSYPQWPVQEEHTRELDRLRDVELWLRYHLKWLEDDIRETKQWIDGLESGAIKPAYPHERLEEQQSLIRMYEFAKRCIESSLKTDERTQYPPRTLVDR